MQPERADMTTDTGRSPSGRATHERSQSALSPPPVGVPNEAPWWRCLHCGCDEYEEHVFTGHMKGVPMVHCANCQILHSPPDPNSKAALRWQISELAEALKTIAEGDEPRPIGQRWRADGLPSKHDQCVHGQWLYDTCGQCVSEFAASAIEAATAGETTKIGSTVGESAVAKPDAQGPSQ